MASCSTLCILCNKFLNSPDDVVTVQQKAAEGINRAALDRGVDIIVTAGISVHISCRIKFTNKKIYTVNPIEANVIHTLEQETKYSHRLRTLR